MNKHLLLALAALPGLLFAQEKSTPSFPLKTPPAGSQWAVAIHATNHQKPASETAAPPQRGMPVRLDSQLGTNGIQRSEITFADGSRQVFFLANGFVLQAFDNSKKISVTPEKNEPSLGLRRQGWPGLSWINPANRAGEEKVGEVPAVFFRMDGMPGSDLPADFAFRAWINSATGQPVRVQLGDQTWDFSPVTAFPQEVILPAEYVEALQKTQTSLRLLEKLGAAKR